VADHHTRLAVEARQAADDRQVVRERAVAVQLVEVGEDFANVVQRVWTLRMTCDLRDLPGRQGGVQVLGQLLAFRGQAGDFFGNVDGRIVLHKAKFFDLRFKFCDRLLELQEGCFHGFPGRLLKARILPDFDRPQTRRVSLKWADQ